MRQPRVPAVILVVVGVILPARILIAKPFDKYVVGGFAAHRRLVREGKAFALEALIDAVLGGQVPKLERVQEQGMLKGQTRARKAAEWWTVRTELGRKGLIFPIRRFDLLAIGVLGTWAAATRGRVNARALQDHVLDRVV